MVGTFSVQNRLREFSLAGYIKKGPMGTSTGHVLMRFSWVRQRFMKGQFSDLQLCNPFFIKILQLQSPQQRKLFFLLLLFTPPGWVLIDRSGRHFGTILNYLRDGSVPLPESTRELGELLGEARYYLVQGLIEDCQLALQVRAPPSPPEFYPNPHVPVRAA